MSGFLNNVVLATEGSEDTALATRAAVDICEKSGAALHMVHAWLGTPSAFPAMISTRQPFLQEKEAEDLLAGEVESIRAAGGNVAGAHLRRGRPAKEICGLAEELDADLVVMGSRGVGAIRRFATGSVSERVARNAACPTLVMRGGEGAWPPRQIVVGDDSSSGAEMAGEMAARIGDLYGTIVTLVRVYLVRKTTRFAAASSVRISDRVLKAGEESLSQRAAELESPLGDRPEVEVCAGDAAAVIQEAAERGGEPTLVALGSRGLGSDRDLTLGDVTCAALRMVSGPVLVAPPSRDVSW